MFLLGNVLSHAFLMAVYRSQVYRSAMQASDKTDGLGCMKDKLHLMMGVGAMMLDCKLNAVVHD